MPPLGALPDDACAAVARRVRDAAALGALRATCRAWNAAIAADAVLWWDLCARTFPWWRDAPREARERDAPVDWARRYRAWHAWQRAPAPDACRCCGYRGLDLGVAEADALLRGEAPAGGGALRVGAALYVRDAGGAKRFLLGAPEAPLADALELRLGDALDDAALAALAARERVGGGRLGVVLVASLGGARPCAVYESDAVAAGHRWSVFRATEHDVGDDLLGGDRSLHLEACLVRQPPLRTLRLRVRERRWDVGWPSPATSDAVPPAAVRALLTRLHAAWAPGA